MGTPTQWTACPHQRRDVFRISEEMCSAAGYCFVTAKNSGHGIQPQGASPGSCWPNRTLVRSGSPENQAVTKHYEPGNGLNRSVDFRSFAGDTVVPCGVDRACAAERLPLSELSPDMEESGSRVARS
jgi:hypothetical protein